MMTLMRPERGRKRGGMLSQVLRPIRTALMVGCGVVDWEREEEEEVDGGEEVGGGCLVMRAK